MSDATTQAPVWTPISGPEWTAVYADVNAQLRHPLPDDTAIHAARLSCYPRHRLLRFVIPMADGSRESYAFHATGELYPIDPGRSFAEFNESALEVETPEQAIDAARADVLLRGDETGFETPERYFPVEVWADLPLVAGAVIDADVRAQAEALLGPPAVSPPDPGDPAGAVHVRLSVAGRGRLAVWTFRVSPHGVDTIRSDAVPGVPLPLMPWPATCERCMVLEREVAFTPERFLRMIAAGRPLAHARVTGVVHARGRTFDAPVSLDHVTFEGDVDFGGATFANGLELQSCSIDGRLVLRDARIDGSLEAPRLRLAGVPNDLPAAGFHEAIDAAGIDVSGSLNLEGLRAPGLVSLEHAKVAGDFRIGGSELGGAAGWPTVPQPAVMLVMSGVQVGGDCLLGHAASFRRPPDPHDEALEALVPGHRHASTIVRGGILAHRLTVDGTLYLGGLRCEGRLDLSSAKVGAGVSAVDRLRPDARLVAYGDLLLPNVTAGASIVLSGMHVGGELHLTGTRIDGSLFVRTGRIGERRSRPAVVRGEVTLSGLRADDVELEGCQIGALGVVTGEIGRLFVHAGLEEVERDGDTVTRVLPARAGAVWLVDCGIAHGIGTEGLVVEAPQGAGLAGSLIVRNVRCGGNVTVSAARTIPFTDPPDAGLAEDDGTLPATRIAGDLDVQGLRAEGAMSLVNLAVGGAIRVRNSVLEQGLYCGAAVAETPETSDRVETRCRMLDLEMTRVDADADLSGIVVSGAGAESSVRAHRLQVAGRLLFSVPRSGRNGSDDIPSAPEARFDAFIEGSLDLSVAEAAHLVVSGSSFSTEDDPNTGITLERGSFRRLHVLEPWPFHHDLSDVRVERWQIPTEHLLTFLHRSRPFRRSTYIEIERVLRNEAQDAEADRVYRGMRDRAIREAKKAGPAGPGDRIGYLARTTGSRLLGWAYGWGTLYWLPILLVALPTFLLSWGLFSAPANIEATPMALVARGIQSDAPVRPTDVGQPWGAADGFWIALRFHVPVVPVNARDLWQPAGEAARLPGLAASRAALPFSAEGYAYAIYLLHWIVWPLFLYGLGRKVIRDRA